MESDTEFNDGLSPRVMHLGPTRSMEYLVRSYGRQVGASENAVTWGCLRGGNALDAGESMHRAIDVGKRAVDEYRELTEAMCLPKLLASIPGTKASNIHATPDGYRADLLVYGAGSDGSPKTYEIRIADANPADLVSIARDAGC